MVFRCSIEGSSFIGAYTLLTNSYLINSQIASSKISSIMETCHGNKCPIITTDLAGTSIVSCLIVGNKYGILAPNIIPKNEIKYLKEELPEIKIRRTDELNSALGNMIACNDHIALVSEELSNSTLEDLADTLCVEPIPITIAKESSIGSYCILTNNGGIVSSMATEEEIESLSELTGLQICTATVNSGDNVLKSGICANDSIVICGNKTSSYEIANIMRALKVEENQFDLGFIDFNNNIPMLVECK
ncbi:Eukaryotic translation initiation factor 6 [Histomonas meleagridis]|uniref:Eukaryotic translation initiation factor 6 n=1 Tax=Histomonas meleagridis TaxID=135588 RepID=UPI00355A2F64|nr:Eukaryotic translation initiation factor 6 [Histomonas meleagridis]KAH0805442.1 Eukaryotic translation initiation factor 6 [Histomonas meleagridis]